jgi:hypothetical protein
LSRHLSLKRQGWNPDVVDRELISRSRYRLYALQAVVIKLAHAVCAIFDIADASGQATEKGQELSWAWNGRGRP